ncbi:hypothetical protein [Chondromyces apiculatus]|nr:hypothetical protein [Chondromyces apiculatus]
MPFAASAAVWPDDAATPRRGPEESVIPLPTRPPLDPHPALAR